MLTNNLQHKVLLKILNVYVYIENKLQLAKRNLSSALFIGVYLFDASHFRLMFVNLKSKKYYVND